MKVNIQKVYKTFGFILAGYAIGGVILDSTGNAISLINSSIALWGSVLLLLICSYLIYQARNNKIDWVLPGGKKVKVKNINRQVLLFFVGLIILL